MDVTVKNPGISTALGIDVATVVDGGPYLVARRRARARTGDNP